MPDNNLLEEFKKAPPAEKTVIVVGVVAVAGLGLYLFLRGRPGGGPSTDSSSPAGQVAGYPSANGTPVLPPGVNPLYDPNGNLIAFQNPGTTTTPTTTPETHPQNWYTSLLGKVGYNAVIHPGGYDVNGQRFWIGNDNSNLFYAPIGTKINRGADGRIWIQLPGETTGQLLTGPGLTASKTAVARTAAKKVT